jgi:hypothetical protein
LVYLLRRELQDVFLEKALERDEDLLSTHMLKKPHHYKNTPLYHHEYGLGAAYEAKVWKVRFPKAPGGVQDLRCDSLKWSDI